MTHFAIFLAASVKIGEKVKVKVKVGEKNWLKFGKDQEIFFNFSPCQQIGKTKYKRNHCISDFNKVKIGTDVLQIEMKNKCITCNFNF